MQTYLVTTTKKNYLKITGNLTKNTSANDLNIMLSVFRFHQHKIKNYEIWTKIYYNF